MRTPLLLALCMFAVPAWAAPKFQVGSISKRMSPAGTVRINGEFPPAKPTIEFTVTLTEDMPMSELVTTIYFFDAENGLVSRHGAGLDTDRMKYVKWDARNRTMKTEVPSTMQAGKKYYFRHVVNERDAKAWKHVVVVVGSNNGERTGIVYPKADPKDFDFSDKAKVTFWSE